MSFSNPNYRLPRVPPPTVRNGYDFDSPSVMEYDEVIYDPRTNRYMTLSQQNEIYQLQQQLAEKKKDERSKLDSIIAYFYNR